MYLYSLLPCPDCGLHFYSTGHFLQSYENLVPRKRVRKEMKDNFSENGDEEEDKESDSDEESMEQDIKDNAGYIFMIEIARDNYDEENVSTKHWHRYG